MKKRERERERRRGGGPSYICGCRLQSIINAMQISSRADKRCNDGCQFPPHRRLPPGTMENEKNDRGRERERGRATMRDDLERGKKVGGNLFGGLFIPLGERERGGTATVRGV